MIIMRLIFFLLTLWCLPVLAQQIAVPELRQQVTDITGTLSTSEQQSLTQQLQDITQKTRAQVAVLIVPSTGDDTIEQYATRVFDAWKLGDERRDDGILILVAWEDRKVRIEVGYGLEGVVTDLLASQVIRDTLLPAFTDSDLMGGLKLGIQSIETILTHGELPQGSGKYHSNHTAIPLSVALLIWMAVLSFYIVYGDPVNLLLVTLSAIISGMLLLYLNNSGPWTRLIVFCGLLTPFLDLLLLTLWLTFNKKVRIKYIKLGKQRKSSRWGSSSSSSSGGSSGGGFSGGGGTSGGGGSSGSW